MPRRVSPFDLLGAVPRAARPQTLLTLIELGSPVERVRYAPMLGQLALQALAIEPGEKPDPEPAAACVCVWINLPIEVRRALRASDIDWLKAAKHASDDHDPARRARIASACVSLPQACGVLPKLLCDPAKGVSKAAGSSLSTLARLATEEHNLDLARMVAPVIFEAIECFDRHRQRSAIEAAWLLMESPAWCVRIGRHGIALAEWLRASKSPSRSAARSVLKTIIEPWVRMRALSWLSEPSVRAAAIDRLARAESAAEHEAVLASSHLLLRSCRSSAVHMLRPICKPVTSPLGTVRRFDSTGPVPTREHCAQLTPTALRALPRWICAMDVAPDDRARALEPVLACDDPWARFIASRSLDATQSMDYLLDPDERIARHACWRWSLAGVGISAVGSGDQARARSAAKLMRSPIPAVRAAAMHQTARYDPTRWTQPISRVAARRWLLKDRQGLISMLSQMLDDGQPESDPETQLGAAMAIDALHLGRELLEPLQARIDQNRAHDPVAASAARALARWANEQSVRTVIDQALAHPDPRVQSNALEGLARWHPDLVESPARSMLDAEAHRPRAAAVRAALSERRLALIGRSALLAMLRDERPMHRVSGCWAVGRTLMPDAAGPLRELAASDTEPGVRIRAAWSLRRLSVGTNNRRPGS